jgi:hypothetical protein
MKSSLKGLTAIAGVTCAIVGAGPVASAAAAPDTTSAGGGTPVLPWLSCGVNQGLLPGIPNLGPTGPLGPLGSSGPGGNDNNLPCGGSAFDLRSAPADLLAPARLLRSSPAPRRRPARRSSPARHRRPALRSARRRSAPAINGRVGTENRSTAARIRTASPGAGERSLASGNGFVRPAGSRYEGSRSVTAVGIPEVCD